MQALALLLLGREVRVLPGALSLQHLGLLTAGSPAQLPVHQASADTCMLAQQQTGAIDQHVSRPAPHLSMLVQQQLQPLAFLLLLLKGCLQVGDLLLLRCCGVILRAESC